MTRLDRPWALTLLALAVAACGDSSSTPNPADQWEITNGPVVCDECLELQLEVRAPERGDVEGAALVATGTGSIAAAALHTDMEGSGRSRTLRVRGSIPATMPAGDYGLRLDIRNGSSTATVVLQGALQLIAPPVLAGTGFLFRLEAAGRQVDSTIDIMIRPCLREPSCTYRMRAGEPQGVPLPLGRYVVTTSDVASNCILRQAPNHSYVLTTAQAQVDMAMECVEPGQITLEVSVELTGQVPPQPFKITFPDATWCEASGCAFEVPVNQTLRLPASLERVGITMSDPGRWCRYSPTPTVQFATPSALTPAQVTFPLYCEQPLDGDVRVRVNVTSNVTDPAVAVYDPASCDYYFGYGCMFFPVSVPGSLLLVDIPPGQHEYKLLVTGGACTVSPASRVVMVEADREHEISFDVNCP